MHIVALKLFYCNEARLGETFKEFRARMKKNSMQKTPNTSISISLLGFSVKMPYKTKKRRKKKAHFDRVIVGTT